MIRTKLTLKRSRRGRPTAFTLVEMLVVIVLIAILMGLAVPNFLGAMNASRLTQAGGQISGVLSQAMDLANSKNRLVEVRFYKVPAQASLDGGAADYYRAITLLEYYEIGDSNPGIPGLPVGEALTTRVAVMHSTDAAFPESIVMSSDAALSTITTALPKMDPSASTASALYKRSGSTYTAALPPTGATEYRSIVFGPNGPMLPETQRWFVTLVNEKDATSAVGDLANFCTVMLDPVTGKVVTYRP